MQPPRRRKQLVTKYITVPGNFQRTCDDFNAGKFFESHEHLEEVWQYETGEVRDAYKGLIQIAAAFVHLTRGNHFGTERLLRTALGYLARYRPDGAMGFDIEAIAVCGGGRLFSGGGIRPGGPFTCGCFPSSPLRVRFGKTPVGSAQVAGLGILCGRSAAGHGNHGRGVARRSQSMGYSRNGSGRRICRLLQMGDSPGPTQR